MINISILFFYMGCTEKPKAEKKNDTEKPIIKFVLNDGNKWQMDEHTRNAIKNLDSLLKSQQPVKSIEESKLLGKKLDEELILLIRGCTMEGPAHDQLHVFLGYFYPMVQDLKKETEVESSKKILAKMENLFVEYHKYFE
jgi:hypothetical protein